MKLHNKRVLKHTNVLARDISTDKVLAFYHRCMEISLHKTFFYLLLFSELLCCETVLIFSCLLLFQLCIAHVR